MEKSSTRKKSLKTIYFAMQQISFQVITIFRIFSNFFHSSKKIVLKIHKRWYNVYINRLNIIQQRIYFLNNIFYDIKSDTIR